jgi:RES domain-containing protein
MAAQVLAQVLDKVLTCYRIGDPDGQYPIFDGAGSTIAPGRWNTARAPMIYASRHYSTAMLEKLAHGSGQLPPNQHFIEITVPNGVTYEMVTPDILPTWADTTYAASRPFGAQWHRERRSAILIAPSVVARMEQNVLINPAHPEFDQIEHGLHQPVWWDSRLF